MPQGGHNKDRADVISPCFLLKMGSRRVFSGTWGDKSQKTHPVGHFAVVFKQDSGKIGRLRSIVSFLQPQPLYS